MDYVERQRLAWLLRKGVYGIDHEDKVLCGLCQCRFLKESEHSNGKVRLTGKLKLFMEWKELTNSGFLSYPNTLSGNDPGSIIYKFAWIHVYLFLFSTINQNSLENSSKYLHFQSYSLLWSEIHSRCDRNSSHWGLWREAHDIECVNCQPVALSTCSATPTINWSHCLSAH